MKILLDECLPLDFRHSFPGHEVHTAQFAGFKGKKNGELIHSAAVAGYDAMLTVDQGMPQQQSSQEPKISIILIRSQTNQLEDLLPLAPAIEKVLETIQRGETVVVPNPRTER